MSTPLKAVRGMRDILPLKIGIDDKLPVKIGIHDILPMHMPVFHRLEAVIRELCSHYCYDEIRFPIVESTALFKRSIGEATDIIEKEMYTFFDRNGDSLSLRPEGTACCVRAGIEHSLLYNQIQRLWYMGPFFRHERPQQGRYRQFHQLGVECFGLGGADTDAEVILLSKRLLDEVGLSEHVKLEINTLGSLETRAKHREALMKYLHQNASLLDEDSQRRLHTNPLRILDSKNPAMQKMITDAPSLLHYLDDASKKHFDDLKRYLQAVGIELEDHLNHRLVRGLDYYCHTVFEWTTTQLGAQDAVCAGGRYDGLVEQLGGKATPAVGFALGIERVVTLMTMANTPIQSLNPHVYIIPENESSMPNALRLSEKLRDEYRIIMGSPLGMKNQMKRADKSFAHYAIIVGEDEKTILCKNLRDNTIPQEQTTLERFIVLLEKLTFLRR